MLDGGDGFGAALRWSSGRGGMGSGRGGEGADRGRELPGRGRVVDVARRHEVLPHQLSDWRRQVRQKLLALPEGVVEGLEVAFAAGRGAGGQH